MNGAPAFLENLATVLCVAGITTVIFQRLRQPVEAIVGKTFAETYPLLQEFDEPGIFHGGLPFILVLAGISEAA